MKLKKRKKIITMLKLIATLVVIPLVFSTFFNGYDVQSVGLQTNTPVAMSIFEFPQQKDFLLALAFVCSVLQVLLIVFNIFYGVSKTMSKSSDNLIGIITSVFELILCVTPILMVGMFCKKNSVLGLTYTIGICPIMYLICGLIFGGLMLAAYIIPVKQPAKKTPVKLPVEVKE
jgi:hypothetical protein